MRIIYLHGFASSPASRKARFFREKLEAAGVSVSVPALDGGDFSSLTISRQFQILAEAARGEPVVLIGSSMGGYVAGLYAARHPEVEKLVLMAPAFDFLRRWPALLGPAAFAAWRETGSLKVHHFGDQAERMVHWDLARDSALWEPIPEFTQPALIFHGRRDETVPSPVSEAFAAHRPHVALHLFDAGHELTEAMEEMWRLTAAFLEIGAE